MRYRSPDAFKMALERAALDKARRAGVAADRVVLLFLFERLLERLLAELGDDALTVKGGVALELRLARARTTRDLDLRALGDPDAMLERLRAAGRATRDDYLSFDIARAGDISGDGVVYEGRRFKVQASLGGSRFRQAFGLDVAVADVLSRAPDHLPTLDTLGVIDAPRSTVPVYPLESHLAEKLHAYTLPRKAPNGRVKDLVDVALIASGASVEADALRAAFDATFRFRDSHDVPAAVPVPPAHWTTAYPALARGNQLPWPSIAEVFDAARRFLDPVLAGESGRWDPTTSTWRSAAVS